MFGFDDDFSPLPVIEFTQRDLERIGAVAIQTEAERIAAGRDVNDQPAKPLSKSYFLQKSARGLAAVRDMRLTGRLLAARQVIDDSDGSITVGFTDDREEAVAEAANVADEMFGISPADKEQVDAEAETIFRSKF